jgi:hypothetical protein
MSGMQASDESEIQKLNKKIDRLTALVESLLSEKLHTIGGYAPGRTTGGDAFLILYSDKEWLRLKICRVYQEDFRHLPAFIDKRVPEAGVPANNPDRDQAKEMGIFRPCPTFLITTKEGKDTQLGPEVRFNKVIEAPNVNRPVDSAPASKPARKPTRKGAPAAQAPGDDQSPNGKQPSAGEPTQAQVVHRKAYFKIATGEYNLSPEAAQYIAEIISNKKAEEDDYSLPLEHARYFAQAKRLGLDWPTAKSILEETLFKTEDAIAVLEKQYTPPEKQPKQATLI